MMVELNTTFYIAYYVIQLLITVIFGYVGYIFGNGRFEYLISFLIVGEAIGLVAFHYILLGL